MKTAISLSFICLLTLVSSAQNPQDYNQFIRHEMDVWNVPGAAVAVMHGDSCLYQGCFGDAGTERGEAVGNQTCFSLASVSKSFTSLITAMMVSEGRFSWDTPVNEIMPDFQMQDEWIESHLTVQDLLSHRTGISRYNLLRDNLSGASDELLKRVAHLPLSGGFRERMTYSNFNYMVLGKLLEHVSDSTWEQLVESRIFTPLGMTNSHTFLADAVENDKAASPHLIYEDSTGPEKLDYHYEKSLDAAGNIVSCLDDMKAYLSYHLTGHTPDGEVLLDERSRSHLYQPVIPARISRETEKGDDLYASGWFVTHYKGRRMIHHGGVLYGYSAFVAFLSEKNTGIVIMTNLNGGIPFTSVVSRYVFDDVLDEGHTDWSARFQKRMEAVKAYYAGLQTEKADEEIVADSLKPSAYAGVYENPAYGRLELLEKEGRLCATLKAYQTDIKHNNEHSYMLVHPVNEQEFHMKFYFDEGEVAGFKADFERGVEAFDFRKTL
jgi:CubicO group peptidase (beta-lactamase class C family)